LSAYTEKEWEMKREYYLTKHAIRRMIKRRVNLQAYKIVLNYGEHEETDTGATVIKGTNDLNRYGRTDVDHLNIVIRDNAVVTVYYG